MHLEVVTCNSVNSLPYVSTLKMALYVDRAVIPGIEYMDKKKGKQDMHWTSGF